MQIDPKDALESVQCPITDLGDNTRGIDYRVQLSVKAPSGTDADEAAPRQLRDFLVDTLIEHLVKLAGPQMFDGNYVDQANLYAAKSGMEPATDWLLELSSG